MRITALLENTTERSDMQVEHGLSLYLETETQKLLFDMGQTDLFYKNAKALNIDLTKVELAILSHGHYDHGGGLRAFLDCNPTAPVLIQKNAFLPHYNGTEKYIGLDPALKNDPRIIFTEEEYRINDRLRLFTCNNKSAFYPLMNSGLTEKSKDRLIPDAFRHEQYLMIEENGKRILISGCSHKGILNIVKWVSPDVLVGGFHFSKLALDSELASISAMLASYPIEFYTCHCTGREQFEWMCRYMPKLHYLSCGMTVTIK